MFKPPHYLHACTKNLPNTEGFVSKTTNSLPKVMLSWKITLLNWTFHWTFTKISTELHQTLSILTYITWIMSPLKDSLHNASIPCYGTQGTNTHAVTLHLHCACCMETVILDPKSLWNQIHKKTVVCNIGHKHTTPACNIMIVRFASITDSQSTICSTIIYCIQNCWTSKFSCTSLYTLLPLPLVVDC